MGTVEIIIIVLGAVLGLVTFGVTVTKVANKIASVSEKGATTLESLGFIAKSYGLENLSMILKEGADIPDELSDLSQMFADLTADGKLTADEVRSLFEEGKELWVELKDFRVKVLPKKE